jgi:hypothetical protein
MKICDKQLYILFISKSSCIKIFLHCAYALRDNPNSQHIYKRQHKNGLISSALLEWQIYPHSVLLAFFFLHICTYWCHEFLRTLYICKQGHTTRQHQLNGLYKQQVSCHHLIRFSWLKYNYLHEAEPFLRRLESLRKLRNSWPYIDLELHHRLHKIPSLVRIPSQMNLVHIPHPVSLRSILVLSCHLR